jgi:hypothetical protein
MSFTLTVEQIRAKSKTVTRRLGWATAKPGQIVQPVVKGMGLKRGEHVEKIGAPIRFVKVSREELAWLCGEGCREVVAEGFPDLTPEQFVAMFCAHNGCTPTDIVTRIEFSYVE